MVIVRVVVRISHERPPENRNRNSCETRPKALLTSGKQLQQTSLMLCEGSTRSSSVISVPWRSRYRLWSIRLSRRNPSVQVARDRVDFGSIGGKSTLPSKEPPAPMSLACLPAVGSGKLCSLLVRGLVLERNGLEEAREEVTSQSSSRLLDTKVA